MARASHVCDPDCPHLREDEIDYGNSLFQQIDLPNVIALNEADSGIKLIPIIDERSGKNVFKPWSERQQPEPSLSSSDGDPELILSIPFISSVNIKSFSIVGGSRSSAPSKVKMWINRDDIDFSNADQVPPTQAFDLNYDSSGEIEYVTKVTKFQNVSHLIMMFSSNFSGGDESTRVNYIGLKGDVMGARRQAVIAVYEAKPTAHNINSGDALMNRNAKLGS